MLPIVCSAPAYAVELSLSAFSATAALIGAAMFAFTSDIAARSGSSSPASSLSSSRVSLRYSSPIDASLVALGDVADRLIGVRVGDRTVARDVQRHGGVDRREDVRVHERHRCALRQRLARQRVEILARQLLVLLLAHVLLLSCPAGCRRTGSRPRRRSSRQAARS